MKQFKLFSAMYIAAGLLFLSSCGGSDEQKTESTNNDSTVTKTETVTKPSDVLIVKFKVSNFAKWKTSYESRDSARLASGLHNYIIGRGVEDSNTVMVALKMDDVAKAKEFTADPKLKEAMQKGGVTGAPSFMFLNVQMMDSSTNATTTRIMVTHKVKDWDAWKKSFDSHKQVRIDAGLLDRAIGYEADDNHIVTVVFGVSDMAKAKAFMASKDLKDKMAEAGVEGPPTIFMYNVVQKY